MLRTTNAHMRHTASSRAHQHQQRPLADLGFYELLFQFVKNTDPGDDAVFTADAMTSYETYGDYR